MARICGIRFRSALADATSGFPPLTTSGRSVRAAAGGGIDVSIRPEVPPTASPLELEAKRLSVICIVIDISYLRIAQNSSCNSGNSPETCMANPPELFNWRHRSWVVSTSKYE